MIMQEDRVEILQLFIILKKAMTVKSSCFYKQKERRKKKHVNRNDINQNLLSGLNYLDKLSHLNKQIIDYIQIVSVHKQSNSMKLDLKTWTTKTREVKLKQKKHSQLSKFTHLCTIFDSKKCISHDLSCILIRRFQFLDKVEKYSNRQMENNWTEFMPPSLQF